VQGCFQNNIIGKGMNNEEDIKKRIITHAEEIFNKYGCSKVTMEEIAQDLRISKKTLYKHFPNKEHVLKAIIHSNKCSVNSFIEPLLADKSMEFIEKLKLFMKFIAKQSSKMDNPLIVDLMKSHPEMWCDIQEFRSKKAHSNLSRLMQQGIKSGIFRKDIHAEVMVLGYVGAIHNLITPDVLATLPISADQVFKEIVKILFEGIFTPEGRKKYKSTKLIKDNYGEIVL
jgi:TetR/AcrR family transcriptional regulator, cholesterol catabolism regulator